MTHLVQIHNRRFTVTDDALEAFQEDILDAVRHGGGFIPAGASTAGPVRMLVTASTPVLIERLPAEEAETSEEADAPEGGYSDFAFFDYEADF